MAPKDLDVAHVVIEFDGERARPKTAIGQGLVFKEEKLYMQPL